MSRLAHPPSMLCFSTTGVDEEKASGRPRLKYASHIKVCLLLERWQCWQCSAILHLYRWLFGSGPTTSWTTSKTVSTVSVVMHSLYTLVWPFAWNGCCRVSFWRQRWWSTLNDENLTSSVECRGKRVGFLFDCWMNGSADGLELWKGSVF